MGIFVFFAVPGAIPQAGNGCSLREERVESRSFVAKKKWMWEGWGPAPTVRKPLGYMVDETAFHVFAITSSLMVPGQLPATPAAHSLISTSKGTAGLTLRQFRLELVSDVDRKESVTWEPGQASVVLFLRSALVSRSVCKPESVACRDNASGETENTGAPLWKHSRRGRADCQIAQCLTQYSLAGPAPRASGPGRLALPDSFRGSIDSPRVAHPPDILSLLQWSHFVHVGEMMAAITSAAWQVLVLDRWTRRVPVC